tara:strand:+ start:302 stop:517 length:216 start_codon:yes stop_codon:yes gene_type:complete
MNKKIDIGFQIGLNEEVKQNLLNLVIEQIKVDIRDNYFEALEEILINIPNENLLGYLPEEVSNQITQKFLN